MMLMNSSRVAGAIHAGAFHIGLLASYHAYGFKLSCVDTSLCTLANLSSFLSVLVVVNFKYHHRVRFGLPLECDL